MISFLCAKIIKHENENLHFADGSFANRISGTTWRLCQQGKKQSKPKGNSTYG
jgi:hypothetical protein